jgi:hypothetical protein
VPSTEGPLLRSSRYWGLAKGAHYGKALFVPLARSKATCLSSYVPE